MRTSAPVANLWAAVAVSADGMRMFAAAQDGGIYSFGSSPRPALSIEPMGSHVLLSWPESASSCRLLENPTWVAENWTTATNPTVTTNGRVQVLLPTSSPHDFFRLMTP